MQPWPTAYTYWHRQGEPTPQRMLIHKAAALSGPGFGEGRPGQLIIELGSSRLLVHAGEGSVAEVRELQPAGKRRMAAAELLRGHRPQPGDHFGPEKS